MNSKLLRVAAVVAVLLAVASVVFFCVKSAQKNEQETQDIVSQTTVSSAEETGTDTTHVRTTEETSFSEIDVPDRVKVTIRDNRAVITMAGEEEPIILESPENYTNAALPSGEEIEIE